MKIFILVTLLLSVAFCNAHEWSTHGKNQFNNRFDSSNPHLSSRTASGIVNAWNYTADGFMSGTPSISADKIAYFCDYTGSLHAIDIANNGVLVWKQNISLATGIPKDYCRATPTLTGNLLLIGSQKSGWFMKFNRITGQFLDKVLLNPHPYSLVTMSATVYGNNAYIGVSSEEELATALDPFRVCCSFRGSFHSINIQQWTIKWTVYGFPDTYPTGHLGLSGVPFWGSTPVIDCDNNLVITGTGNPYRIPQAWVDCQAANPSSTTCIPDDVLFNSVVAYDLETGDLQWVSRHSPYDAWVVACIIPPLKPISCPTFPGPDADFGMSPSLRDGIIYIGQKSGVAWKLDAATGTLLDSVNTGPGGTLGGVSWGGALDDDHYYLSDVNNGHEVWDLIPSGGLTQQGFFTKIDSATFDITCQVEIPFGGPFIQSSSVGAPLIVNDLWIVTSTNPSGNQIHILNKNTCEIIKSFPTGTTVYGGASAYGKCFFIGTGYKPLYGSGWTVGESKLFAFCLP